MPDGQVADNVLDVEGGLVEITQMLCCLPAILSLAIAQAFPLLVGGMVDSKGGAKIADTARAKAAVGAWFRHRICLTRRCVPLGKRLHHLYATAVVAFMFGSGGAAIGRLVTTVHGA